MTTKQTIAEKITSIKSEIRYMGSLKDKLGGGDLMDDDVSALLVILDQRMDDFRDSLWKYEAYYTTL